MINDVQSILKFLLTLLKLLVAVLPFAALCLCSNKANLPKTARSKQILMLPVTVVFSMLMMLLQNKLNELLLKIINNIPLWIAAVSKISFMPKAVGDVFLKIAGLVQKLLDGLNLNFWIFFVANIVIIIVYLIIKKAAVAIMDRSIKQDGDLHMKIATRFYEYFPERNKWCIKENYVQMRSLLKVFYYSCVVVSIILMLISRKLYFAHLIKAVFYPVYGIIIVGELYFYLDGFTKREYSENILGEDEDAYKVVNYSLLRKFLRSIFGDKLLAENTDVNSDLAYTVTTNEILKSLSDSDDLETGSFAAYYDRLYKSGFGIDHNYLYSSMDMLHGKSILFNDPFYNDLVPYAFYPMNSRLLRGKKVLVVLGRHSIENDIMDWISKGIKAVTNIPFMWNVGVLTEKKQDLDIGVITRSDVLNMDLMDANSDFLENVGFCVILEPSKLISTAQIGLNLVAKKINKNNEENAVVYCMCDKNCDGLIDAMSHILMTSITEVSATNKHLGTSSYMCWDADDEYLHHRMLPNISRYLGVGTELSLAALKNQVSTTKWFGGETFPVTDMSWITKQYYYDLTKYAGLPTSQKELEGRFHTTPNYWSAEVERYSYITVEDEAYNMFEVLRDFMTRTTEQGFINVVSADYMLKEYMADNASVFETDAKAIPCIVPDYTRSNRNVILKLMLMLSTAPVNEDVIAKELSLVGISVFDICKQLWYELYLSYADLADIGTLPAGYKDAVEVASERCIETSKYSINISLIRKDLRYDFKTGEMITVYFIKDKDFLSACISELKSAAYIAEDEKGEKNYLGSELSGHVYQKYLPGQFFTFDGKYYEMQYLTPDNQVLVRRAADHINGRLDYRQMRTYKIKDIQPSSKIGADRNIDGFRVSREYADIEVVTPGYYRMSDYGNFKTAKKISFEGENNGIPERNYHNKEILKIELPEVDGTRSDSVRYTITVLLNEIFRSVFAENQPYITALTDKSFMTDKDSDVLTYTIESAGYDISDNCIYIVEDSQLDLGLLVAVDRNIERFLNIIQDYLEWHLVKMEESLDPPEDPEPNIVIEEEDEEEGKKKKCWLKRLFERIKAWFKKVFGRKRKKGKPEDESVVPEEEPAAPEDEPVIPEDESVVPEEELVASEDEPVIPEDEPVVPEDEPVIPEDEPVVPEDESVAPAAPTDIPDDPYDIPIDETVIPAEPIGGNGIGSDIPGTQESSAGFSAATLFENGKHLVDLPAAYEEDDDETVDTAPVDTDIFGNAKKPYHDHYYLLFGGENEPKYIDPCNTLDYLDAVIGRRNPLRKARESKLIAEYIESTYEPGKPDARYCDFCGTEIYGVEYETLADGRDRCICCGRSAIKTEEEFRTVFEDVRRNMESFFGIKLNVGVRVEMVNSAQLHKRLGESFVPTSKCDGRILGVAINDKNGFSLLVENGSPRMASMLTMAHELTHIWQYVNWNSKYIKKKYGKQLNLEIYEGMAKWVEIQYAYLINEPAVAKREEIITCCRDDEYGRGFLRYRMQYPFSLGTVITKPTPFMNIAEPLDMLYCGNIRYIPPEVKAAIPVDPEEDERRRKPVKTKPIIPRIKPDPGKDDLIEGDIDRDPDNVRRYFYEMMNDDEKAVYDCMVDAIYNFVPEISDLPACITFDRCKEISLHIIHDHPELFWFNYGCTYTYDLNTNIVDKIKFVYCMSRAEKEEREAQIANAIKPFLDSIRDGMSDYEVTLRVYENIIKLVDYDTIGLDRQEKLNNVSFDTPDDLRSVYGVFVNKKAVCAGYARATQYLLNKFGIECAYVVSDTHAWNLIKLEGDYYHLDTTWGDASNTDKTKSTEDVIFYDCFCITTEELNKLEMHRPEEHQKLPVCKATKCNYFHRHGLYFESFDYNRMRDIICNSIMNDVNVISFKFATNDLMHKSADALIDGGKFREAVKYANLKSGKKVDLSYIYYVKDEYNVVTFALLT